MQFIAGCIKKNDINLHAMALMEVKKKKKKKKKKF